MRFQISCGVPEAKVDCRYESRTLSLSQSAGVPLKILGLAISSTPEATLQKKSRRSASPNLGNGSTAPGCFPPHRQGRPAQLAFRRDVIQGKFNSRQALPNRLIHCLREVVMRVGDLVKQDAPVRACRRLDPGQQWSSSRAWEVPFREAAKHCIKGTRTSPEGEKAMASGVSCHKCPVWRELAGRHVHGQRGGSKTRIKDRMKPTSALHRPHALWRPSLLTTAPLSAS